MTRNYLLSQPNDCTTISNLSETVMCEFWFDYIKPEHGENAKLCYMDTDSFIGHVKTDYIYKDIPKEVWIRFE